MLKILRILAIGFLLLPHIAKADTVVAYCKVENDDKNIPTTITPCIFSQRQGYSNITFPNNERLSFSPENDGIPGGYRDQDNNHVQREAKSSPQSLIYKFKSKMITVYWDATSLVKSADIPDLKPGQKPQIKTVPLDSGRVVINIKDHDFVFSGLLLRSFDDVFVATQIDKIGIMETNSGDVYIIQRRSGKLLKKYKTTPIPTFENPDTMCDKTVEPC